MNYCICCGTKSVDKIKPQSTSIRCKQCEVVFDLRTSEQSINEDVAGLSLSGPLTLHLLEVTVDEARSSSNMAALEKLIRSTFSSLDMLSKSFQCENFYALDDARQAYHLIVQQPSTILKSLMESIMSLLIYPKRSEFRPSDVRGLLILLENPLLCRRTTKHEIMYHHAILSFVLGMLTHLPVSLLNSAVKFLSCYDADAFRSRIDLVNVFITQQLTDDIEAHSQKHLFQRHSDQQYSPKHYTWRLAVGAKAMALFIAANDSRHRLNPSCFYNTRIDALDILKDYDGWLRNDGSFFLCQYPFLISLGQKMAILEFDARQQMEEKMKQALVTAITQRHFLIFFLVIRVRRQYLIQDSLDQIAAKKHELKKKLRIEFVGEDGIDAGGLTKEWFLLLVRDLFQPQYGMFQYHSDSNCYWFNPASLENEEEFYLVGVVLGLAIYNSTILDIHFPSCCYKKLLGIDNMTMEDLAQVMPTLAHGLIQLLEYDGDVSEMLCRDFVASYDAFGEEKVVPLLPGGEKRRVTNDNRKEYVTRYIDFLLNASIKKQFDSFKKGFLDVMGGNALELFRPEEIELIVIGSHDIDLSSLQAVTVYDGFKSNSNVVRWFWDIVNTYPDEMKKSLLSFVTGSDRVPSTGTASMAFKISNAGRDVQRLPVAHTCFNQLCLYEYRTKSELQEKLSLAINESSGFNLK